MSGISLSEFRALSLQEQDWFIFRIVREQQDQEQAMSSSPTSIDPKFPMKRTF